MVLAEIVAVCIRIVVCVCNMSTNDERGYPVDEKSGVFQTSFFQIFMFLDPNPRFSWEIKDYLEMGGVNYRIIRIKFS